MEQFPAKLEQQLQKRIENNSLRILEVQGKGIDFYSNDYLGFSKSEIIKKETLTILKNFTENGATGSRLLSGNHSLFKQAETLLSGFHNAEAALIFNSGYDANIGFFSAVPQKNDIIIYDEFSHASIRDGLKMSLAKSYKFKHNDLQDLEKKLNRHFKNKPSNTEIYLVTESVFSMDGDIPHLESFLKLKEKYPFLLIIDEAHATGVFGKKGEGLLQTKAMEKHVFARIHTFGKALGCHGAAILGSQKLIDYLINFARSFIYTTALSTHAVANIIAAYKYLNASKNIEKLKSNIHFFHEEIKKYELQKLFIESDSAIQSCIIPGNENVKKLSEQLKADGFLVKPILSPTVAAGSERLRFCIHSFNSFSEITQVLGRLATFVRKD